jgi:putative hydrolase of the HAD superfamily
LATLKALVFDLDDTLFAEETYVRSGFQAVADWLEGAGLLSADQAFAEMWSAHVRGERGRIFDALLAARPACGQVSVSDLVQVYRAHAPDIKFYPGIEALLDEAVARSLRVAVISDGFLLAQQQKAQALGLSRWADPILFTDQWGRPFWKPNPAPFRKVQETLQVGPAEIVYIGDNPAKDFQAPNSLGWQTIHLVMPGQFAMSQPGAPAKIRANGVPELRVQIFGPGG